MIDKHAQAIQRGQNAQVLLNDPLVQEALAEIEQDLISEWKNAGTSEQRDKCWSELSGIAKFPAKLHSYVSRGQYAKSESKNV